MKLRELREFLERGQRAQVAVDRVIAGDRVTVVADAGPESPKTRKKTPRARRRRSTS
jgi:hypothetical protein